MGYPITAVLLVVMGGLAAWNGYQYWQNRQASQAAALLDAVEVAVQARDQARVELAFGDLKSKYAGTPQADMGAFASAKAMQDSGNLDAAKSALTWVAENTPRMLDTRPLLSSVFPPSCSSKKITPLPCSNCTGNFPAEFEGVVADRKGDLLVLLDRRADAIAEYKIAFRTLDETIEYRRLVEIKLNALGVDPLGAPSTASTSQELKK